MKQVHAALATPTPLARGGRLVVAMSGGVDSSVAAALLHEQGHDIIGLSMQLYDHSGDGGFGSCCTLDDLQDARRVASRLGVPHYILNLEREFREAVVSDFVRQYASGRTPLPCARCNSDLKFSTLVHRASGLGSAHVATGHYARVEQTETGSWRLLRSLDREKDQSYFLFSLTQEQLSKAIFPVGHLHKPQVRAHARRLGLDVAGKPDSQEICFVPDGDYASFVAKTRPLVQTAGPIVTEHGYAVGRHGGVHRFTIGQRKGLGVAASEPLYVLRIDARTSTVVVGARDRLERLTLTASDMNWIATAPPDGWLPVTAQIRHRHRAAAARVRALSATRAEVAFDEPQLAVTPGQAVVVYEGDAVLGGGWID